MNRDGTPTTYKRIVPDRGCGFILKRIYELEEAPTDPRKQDVYFGTKWANRPGFASLLWSSLVKDGLIESNGGIRNYKCWSWGCKNHVAYRAAGLYVPRTGYTVRYRLTSKGRGVLFDMMARVNAKNKTQPKLNTVGSVAEFDAKKDGCPVKASEWREDDFLLPGETKEEWAKRNGVTLLEEDAPHKKNETHDILEKEAVHCANLAADYIGEAQKLRAEKKNLNECLKKISARLEWVDNEISDIRNVLAEITGW